MMEAEVEVMPQEKEGSPRSWKFKDMGFFLETLEGSSDSASHLRRSTSRTI